MKNFFEHQDAARRNTTRLIVLFGVAMLVTFLSLYVLTLIPVTILRDAPNESDLVDLEPDAVTFHFSWWDLDAFFLSLFGTLGVVGGGALWKTRQLARGGGSMVCEQLGGRFIDLRSEDPDEQRLINVAQEMAIASGVSVPLLYVLDHELSINAFAAGFSTNNAAIAVSRGALKLLTRDELQGVIAHEFSHILNGDMRLNIRMIGILHGLLMIGLGGIFLMRMGLSSATTRSRNSDGGIPLSLILGAALTIIGYGGRFVGNVIKSAISRQREFLADASAVQFTRNPAGLSGALQKIGGLPNGSFILASNAEEVSHMFFGEGIDRMAIVAFFYATHPPLKTRIQRIDPHFNGQFPTVTLPELSRKAVDDAQPATNMRGRILGEHSWRDKRGVVENLGNMVLMGEALAADGGQRTPQANLAAAGADIRMSGEEAVQATGRLTAQHVDHARQMLQAIPEALRDAARDPWGASGVAFALLLDADPRLRAEQFDMLGTELTNSMTQAVRDAARHLEQIDSTLYLPLVEILMPALRTLSQAQFQAFTGILDKLINADNKVTLFEFSLKRLIEHRLQPSHGAQAHQRPEFFSLSPLRADVGVLLSFLAHAGSDDPVQVHHAYVQGVELLAEGNTKLIERMPLLGRHQLAYGRLDGALNRIAGATNGVKHRIVRATAACVFADQVVSPGEAQLLRVMCEVIDVPLPPFLPQFEAADAAST